MKKLLRNKWFAISIFLSFVMILSISIVGCGGGGGDNGPLRIEVSGGGIITVGDMRQFTARAIYEEADIFSPGYAEGITNKAIWTSSNTAVATIDSSGLATGIAEGSTDIIATFEGISGKTTLTVVASPEPPPPPPGEYIDQQQTVINTSPGPRYIGAAYYEMKLAQLVTVGISGILTEVRFPVCCYYGDLIIEIQGATPNGIYTPNGTILTSEIIPGINLPDFFPYPPQFRSLRFSTPITFSSGDHFAIVLRSSGECVTYHGPEGDSYLGGSAFFDSTFNPAGTWVRDDVVDDLAFQTVVGQ